MTCVYVEENDCEFQHIQSWILKQPQLPKDIWKLIWIQFVGNDLLWRPSRGCIERTTICMYCMMQKHDYCGENLFQEILFKKITTWIIQL